MKKAIALLLALVMCLSLCACGGSNNTPETTEAPTEAPTEPPVPREVLGLEACIEFLKDQLKNPSSLEVHKVRYIMTNTVNIYYEIDYTAENSFGGADRDTIYMTGWVTFGSETSEPSGRIDTNYKECTENWGITEASIRSRKTFNEKIGDVKSMDKDTIQEIMG